MQTSQPRAEISFTKKMRLQLKRFLKKLVILDIFETIIIVKTLFNFPVPCSNQAGVLTAVIY